LSQAGATYVWLWLAVVASGLYHGVNPGMGWPLAVSAGLMEKSPRALLLTLFPLSAGHLLAILVMLLPFGFLLTLAERRSEIQVAAAFLVVGFGVFRLLDRRHPKSLARIPPTQLGLWSFAIALAHGAGLMLVPIYLRLCRAGAAGDRAAGQLIEGNVAIAVVVAIVHVAAMIAAGGCMAWLVYRYLGLRFVSRSWFNLDATWAISLILVGGIALAFSLVEWI
jgi:hypothetical protein